MMSPKNWSEAQKRQASVSFMVVIFIGLLALGSYSVYNTIFGPFKITPEGERLAAQFRAAIASDSLQKEQEKQALLDAYNQRATLPKPTNNDVSIPGLASPSELRVVLKKSGLTDEQLAKVTDAELMSLYQQTLADQNKTSSNPTGTANLEQLSSMTPGQIRDFLIKSGMKKVDLDKVDDKTLQDTFQKVLASQISAQKGTGK